MVIVKSTNNYDLIVIGSGPAGEKGAAQAAYFGKKVALVERDLFLGGAAAGTTIPSKTLRETSLVLSGIRALRLHGIGSAVRQFRPARHHPAGRPAHYLGRTAGLVDPRHADGHIRPGGLRDADRPGDEERHSDRGGCQSIT